MNSDLTPEEWKRLKATLPKGLAIEALERIRNSVLWQKDNREIFGGFRSRHGSITDIKERAGKIHRLATDLLAALEADPDKGEGLFFRQHKGVSISSSDMDPEYEQFLGALTEIAANAAEQHEDAISGIRRLMAHYGEARSASQRATDAAFGLWEDYVGSVPVSRESAFVAFAKMFHEMSGSGNLKLETLIARIRELRKEAAKV